MTEPSLVPLKTGGRISVNEIARQLSVGRLTVYSMLEKGIIPGIRLGHRWIITRYAYGQWERSCGMAP
jgi:excisionase family DNA binding protein